MTLSVLSKPSVDTSLHAGSISNLSQRGSGSTTFLSCVTRISRETDPLAFLAAGDACLGRGALFWQPSQRKVLVGIGAAHVQEASGPERFRQLSTALNTLGSSLIRTDRSPFPILAGAAFHDRVDPNSIWRDFPAAAFMVPNVLLQIEGSEVSLRVTIALDEERSTDCAERELHDLLSLAIEWSHIKLPSQLQPVLLSDRALRADSDAWQASVACAVEEIRRAQYQKVVLARQERLDAEEPFSPFHTLDRLHALNPSATLFAIRQGDAWFLGASPERLVRLRDGQVDVSCLAGSIGLGNSEAESRELAKALLHSMKDREEHELVVGPIMQALEGVCDDVKKLPASPRVVTARSVQHLETPISARMKAAGQVLDLVERLHPTPAVGGYPRAAAQHAIAELERIERGWYAGPFGWTDLEGNGEFIVALRSALLDGATATLFAGCGIVQDSIPAREYEESRLKMRPMLAALGAE
jgi:isochorismate synthase